MSDEANLAHLYAVRAESDFESALVLFHVRSPGTANNVCFHCHQAVEKYLKAFLNERLAAHPRTHDLVALLRQCAELEQAFEGFSEACDRLNSHMTEARYPDDYVEYDYDDAQKALDDAAPIREFVLDRLHCWKGSASDPRPREAT